MYRGERALQSPHGDGYALVPVHLRWDGRGQIFRVNRLVPAGGTAVGVRAADSGAAIKEQQVR